MKLYFFRHAIAESIASADMEDAKRKLTDEGKARTKKAAAVLAALGVRPAKLYSSPLVRALQTADLLAPALGLKVEVRDEMAHGFDVNGVAALIHDLSEDEDVMFVGHEPDFSGIIAKLTGGDVKMKKGGLARVDVTSADPLRGTLVWLLPPKVFNTFED